MPRAGKVCQLSLSPHLVRRGKLLKMPVLLDILSMPPLPPVDSNMGSKQEGPPRAATAAQSLARALTQGTSR
jgi:hypothetical protein